MRQTENVPREQVYAQLLEQAKKAYENAYAPLSGFRVGAAIMTEDGTVYVGCNIENTDMNLGICAERTAYAKAVSDGHRRFSIVAVACEKAKDAWPCGLCRQFMSEFGRDTVVVSERGDGALETSTIGELLPR